MATDFFLVQNSTMGEANFNHFNRLRNQLVIATENSGKEENLSRVLIPTKSKDMDGQLKLFQMVVNVVDQANRQTCMTLLRYNVDKLESSYVHVRLIAGKEGDEKFREIVYVKFKLKKFIYLFDVMNSVYDKTILKKTNSSGPKKVIAKIYSFLFFFAN